MDSLRFTIPEILSLIGLAQCVYILVYMGFRSGDMRRAALPFLYFLVLGCAFFLDFAASYIGQTTYLFDIWRWISWFSGPPLSVLLVIQVARISRLPAGRDFGVLLLVPAAFMLSWTFAGRDPVCGGFLPSCPVFHEWLVVTGLLAGVISILVIWRRRDLLADLHAGKAGKDRYWLVIMLVVANLAFLAAMLASLTTILKPAQTLMIRTVLGLGLVYLSGTSLFRIYPQALQTVTRRSPALDDRDKILIGRIEVLLDLEKVYQEPSYGRGDLARELNISEAELSRLVNLHFGKALPRILNERRVADAQRLLRETDAPINAIARDSGFNSITSFNRVFRQLAGASPGEYRVQTEQK